MVWFDLLVWVGFFFSEKTGFFPPGQLSWEQAKNLHGSGTAAESVVKSGMPISQANHPKTGLEIS